MPEEDSDDKPRVRRLDFGEASQDETSPPDQSRVRRLQFAEPATSPEPAAASQPGLLFGGGVSQTLAITEDDLKAVDPTAVQEELLRAAMIVVKSFSLADPASRFAVFGSELQEEYGQLLDESLKLAKDPRLTKARGGLKRVLDAVDAVDFTSLVTPQGGFLGFFKKTADPSAVRPVFEAALRKVKRQQKRFDERLELLNELKIELVEAERLRKELLAAIHAHILAGRAVCMHLADQRKESLRSRILSLETTAVSASSDQSGEMLQQVVDALIGSIRDTLLTWVPVWLSTANDTFVLVENERFTQDAETYRRLLASRTKILELKGRL